MSSLPSDPQPSDPQPSDPQPSDPQPSDPQPRDDELGQSPCDDAPPQAPEQVAGSVTRPLVERAEVAWTVACIAMAMVLSGWVAMLPIWSASPEDGLSAPPQFLTDINSAPAAELALLPGIGPELAGRIVAERQSSGHFASAQQLARVRGIGPKTIEQVIPLVICGEPTASPSPLQSPPGERVDTP